MGGLVEPWNILAGNLPAHGVHNSKWFRMCAFRLKKCVVVGKLLHRKVWKVPKNGCVRGGGVMWMCCTPNPATKCMQLLGDHHYIPFQLQMQRKMTFLTAAVFVHPPSAPHSQPTISHWGGGMRDSRFVRSSIQAVQRWSNVNNIILNVREKREQLFFKSL